MRIWWYTSDKLLIVFDVIDDNGTTFNVVFPAGENVTVLNIPINDNNVVEGNKTTSFYIDQSSLPSGITIDDHNQTTVTMIDDDCE